MLILGILCLWLYVCGGFAFAAASYSMYDFRGVLRGWFTVIFWPIVLPFYIIRDTIRDL